MVREYIIVRTNGSLGDLIERLTQVKRDIPEGALPEDVRLRGDDIFGRHILVSYARPETEEERARDRLTANPQEQCEDCLAA